MPFLSTVPISSTEYRETLDPTLVPPAVHAMVIRDGLYGASRQREQRSFEW